MSTKNLFNTKQQEFVNTPNHKKDETTTENFFVDPCFKSTIGRLMIDETPKGTYKNFEDQTLYTFEEFICRPSTSLNNNNIDLVKNSKKNQIEKGNFSEEGNFLEEGNFSEEGKIDLDGFYNISLTKQQQNEIPDDPLINNNNYEILPIKHIKPSVSKRSLVYVVKDSINTTTKTNTGKEKIR